MIHNGDFCAESKCTLHSAQSNQEWFVAKPIGRLGGPGLIPVSYVLILNMATG